MIRLLGFLVGSAVSIGIFLLILGVPDINLSEQLVNEENIESVSRIAEDVAEDLETITTEIIEEVTEEMPKEVTETVAEMVVPAEADPVPQETEFETSQLDEFQPDAATKIQDGESITGDIKWHAFWNPFRSRIAAEGFVGQLEKVTGLDYRVVKIKTGVYEVTFAYENDDERREKMSLIASAAGLDLPDS